MTNSSRKYLRFNKEPLSGDTSTTALDDWFDTKLVLAVDTASTGPLKYYLIYKYEVYDVEYLDSGGERRVEEPEQNEPPKLCNGSDAFTVAILEVSG